RWDYRTFSPRCGSGAGSGTWRDGPPAHDHTLRSRRRRPRRSRMPADGCWLTSETDAAAAVARFLDDFAGPDRAQALHLVLKQLRRRVEPDRVLACELAWEVHMRSYWSQFRDADDRPYESEEAYFKEVLSLASWRTAYKRLAVGRMLSAIPGPE